MSTEAACRTTHIKHLVRSAGARGAVAGRRAGTGRSVAGRRAGVAGAWAAGSQGDAGVSDGVTATESGAAGRAVARAAGAGGVPAGLLLGLVLDEVHFGFGRRGRRRRGNADLRLVFGPLDQHVDQSLFGVLLHLRYDRGGRGGRGRGLDEDDLVVFLRWGHRLDLLGSDVLLFWWRHVHVDVLLHDRGGRRVVVARVTGTASTRETGTATARVTGADRGAGVSGADRAAGVPGGADRSAGVSGADRAAGVSGVAAGVTAAGGVTARTAEAQTAATGRVAAA